MGAQRFKRDNELVKEIEVLIEAVNTPYHANIIKKLIEKYEDATFAEWKDADEFVANSISDFTNSFSFPDELIAKKMANEHCTLQQSFMRLCMKFIKEMSEKKYWDGRNEASVKTAKKIMEAFGNEPIGLPCV
jgi:hypothetical protein